MDHPPSSWDSLRKQARNLEAQLDEQMHLYRKMVISDSKENDLESGIDHLLKQLQQVISHMQAWVSSGGSEIFSHTLTRHQEILQDLSQEFNRLRSSLKARKEHASLLEDFREFDRTRLDLEEGGGSVEQGLLKEHASISRSSGQSLKSVTLTDLPMFPYLTDLGVEMEDSWSVLPQLLRYSPNLITLDLNQECEHGLDEEAFGTLNCSMLHLKSVHMRRFGWSQYEMDMVKYFLKYAPVLKKISINFVDPLSPGDSDLCKELFMFPKASTACELEIFSYDSSTRDYIPLSSRYLD